MPFISVSHLLSGISNFPSLETVSYSLHPQHYSRNGHVCATAPPKDTVDWIKKSGPIQDGSTQASWSYPWMLLIGSGVRFNPSWANESFHWEFEIKF